MDDQFYDVSDDYYHSVGDDAETFPTSHFLGRDWTAVEGIVGLRSFCSVSNAKGRSSCYCLAFVLKLQTTGSPLDELGILAFKKTCAKYGPKGVHCGKWPVKQRLTDDMQ